MLRAAAKMFCVRSAIYCVVQLVSFAHRSLQMKFGTWFAMGSLYLGQVETDTAAYTLPVCRFSTY